MSKIKKNLTLYDNTLEYLELVKQKNSLTSISAAIDLVVQEHKTNSQNQVDIIANRVADIIHERYENLFTRIRLGTTTADRNSQVIIEALNSLILNLEVKDSYSTDVLESTIIADSKDTVKKRIEHYKQLKDNKSHKNNY